MLTGAEDILESFGGRCLKKLCEVCLENLEGVEHGDRGKRRQSEECLERVVEYKEVLGGFSMVLKKFFKPKEWLMMQIGGDFDVVVAARKKEGSGR